MATERKIAVMDLETDPFQYGRVPQPFVSGFYDGEKFVSIWDEKECIARTVAMLAQERTPLILYAHNGGRFDWYYFLDYFSDTSNVRIVNGRIIQAYMGQHEIRDSFAIMPFALSKYEKKEIDYTKMERHVRKSNRQEIIDYLRSDCVTLHKLVTTYLSDFGDVLTIGSAAMRQLKKFHTFKQGDSYFDAKIRPNYYYGGRVSVFTPGIVEGDLQVYDVNSMYPYVMATCLHPVGVARNISRDLEPDTSFVDCEGYSNGAFAVRSKVGIDFPVGFGRYTTTIHEYNAAVEVGAFRTKKIHKTYGFERASFEAFIHHFYNERLKAKLAEDKIHDLFFKYLINSSYGKFAQNPSNFKEYKITNMEPLDLDEWKMEAMHLGKHILWSRPSKVVTYYNIATAASITGAARAVLLRGLYSVDRPCYCDTDSIIAHGPGTLHLSETELGGWKTEVSARSAAFSGKKMYALFDAAGKCVKKASKGVTISAGEIKRAALGEEITTYCDVPHFKLSGKHGFVSRRVNRTV